MWWILNWILVLFTTAGLYIHKSIKFYFLGLTPSSQSGIYFHYAVPRIYSLIQSRSTTVSHCIVDLDQQLLCPIIIM